MKPELRAALAAATVGRIQRRDPHRHFSYECNGRVHEPQRRFVQAIGQGLMVHLRSGNDAGKTWIGAHLSNALLRGEPELGGIRIPVLEMPATGWCLFKVRSSAVDSVQKAMRAAVGDWPHHEAMVQAGLDYLGAMWVRPTRWRSNDWRTWSKLVFVPEGIGARGGGGNRAFRGARIDFAWADEPPWMKIWREIIWRRKPNQPYPLFITETPEERPEWEELRAEFADAVGVPKNGRLEIQCSIFDNPWLSREFIQEQIEKSKNDPLFKARIYGEYCDTDGSCPLPFDLLQAGLERCSEIEPDWQELEIRSRRPTKFGRVLETIRVPFQWWRKPVEGEMYYLPGDPSKGIKDGQHAPCGIHVYSLNGRELVARFNGYLPPYGMGSMMAAMGRQYNEGLVDVENNGGYGEAAFDALADCEYGAIMPDVRKLRRSAGMGFTTSGVHRAGPLTEGSYVGGITRLLQEDSVQVWSREVWTSLMALRVDEFGRVKNIQGNQEDFVCLGRFANVEHILAMFQSEQAQEEQPGFAGAVNRAFGRDVIPVDEWTDESNGPVDRWR
jgi:hypothetical protein